MSGLDKTRGENSKKVSELSDALKRKEAEMSAFRVQLAEEESQLNSKYVSKMQELYDRVSRKELEMLSRWEEKNKALDSKYGSLEAEYSGKARQFKLREKAMADEFNSRKEELIKTFDRIRLELDARESDIAEREEKLTELEKKTPQAGGL